MNANFIAWSYDIQGHAKKCVEKCCDLANNRAVQMYKVSTLSIDDHRLRTVEMTSVGQLSKVCSHTVLQCLYLARIGRWDTLWSVNKLARAGTKVDQGVRQTLGNVDLVQSSYERL